MAEKTIALDLEAYELLARHLRPGQSFSEVVKQHFARPKTGRDLSDETLDAIERQIEARSADPARAAHW